MNESHVWTTGPYSRPARYGKPYGSLAGDARGAAPERPPVIRPDREVRLEYMGRPGSGRPFTYPDLPMAGIACLRHVAGRGVRAAGDGRRDAGRGREGPRLRGHTGADLRPGRPPGNAGAWGCVTRRRLSQSVPRQWCDPDMQFSGTDHPYLITADHIILHGWHRRA